MPTGGLAFQAVPALLVGRRGSGFRCRARSRRFGSTRLAGDASLTAPKKWRRTSGSPPACPGGMCERGARPPFTKWKRPIGTRRSARQRAREFRLPARSAGRFGRGGSIPSDSTIRTHPTMCPPFRNARPLGAERRAVREGGSIPSDSTIRTHPTMCPPPGPLDLKAGQPPAPLGGSPAGPGAADHSKRRYSGRHS